MCWYLLNCKYIFLIKYVNMNEMAKCIKYSKFIIKCNDLATVT